MKTASEALTVAKEAEKVEETATIYERVMSKAELDATLEGDGKTLYEEEEKGRTLSQKKAQYLPMLTEPNND